MLAELHAIKRNDLAAAVAYAKSAAAALGYVPAKVSHHLWMLQDDPSALVAELRKLPSKPEAGALSAI